MIAHLQQVETARILSNGIGKILQNFAKFCNNVNAREYRRAQHLLHSEWRDTSLQIGDFFEVR